MKKNFYTFKKVNDNVVSIWSGTGEIMYLIEGKDRSLLMDTNLGVRGLRELVDTLTGKEYDVVITHGHLDHALGTPEFRGKNVYMSHADIPMYKEMCPIKERDGYIRGNLGELFSVYDINEKDYCLPDEGFDFIDLEDGKVFDLGDLHVEIVAYPGHTPGSVALFIAELRTLITGDACNNSTFLFDDCCSSVPEYRETTVRIRDRFAGKLDHVYICHHEMEVGTDIFDNIIDLCDDVLAGKGDDIPFEFMGKTAYIAKKVDDHFHRLDGKCGNFIYK